MNYISGDISVQDDDTIAIVQETESGITVISEDDIGTIVTGDQGPPGVRGNSVLYGNTDPLPSIGVNGDFYINTVSHFMWGPKTIGIWFAPGVSLIGPQGPIGLPGPQGPMGAPGLPGNQMYYGAGPPANSIGRPGDSYIDQTNHVLYGPKQSDNTWPSSGASLIGPPGPVGPAGPPPWKSPPVTWSGSTAYTSVAPADLVQNGGATYVCAISHTSSSNFSTDLAAGYWKAIGATGGGGSGSTVYVGDNPPTGIDDNSLWWNTSDGCLYIYFNDGNSKQWVISSPVADLSQYLALSGGTLTGPLIQAADPVAALGTATKQYVDAHAGGGGLADAPSDGADYGRKNATWDKVLGLSGGTMTGAIVLAADPVAPLQPATKQYADGKLALAGGTLTGPLVLAADPTAPLQPATKQYADTHGGIPDAPSDGTLYGRKNAAWAPASASVIISDTPPPSPGPGQLWWNSTTGYMFIWYNDGSSSQWVIATPVPDLSQFLQSFGHCQFAYVTTTQCLLSPKNGDSLRINGVVQHVPAAGVAISNAGLTASTLYYIYAYMVGAVMTLEASATGHATDTSTANNGTEIKSGDPTRTLVGMIATDATSLFADSPTQVFVRSWFNRRRRIMQSPILGSNAALNASAQEFSTKMRLNFVCWADDVIQSTLNASAVSGNVGAAITMRIGYDGGSNISNPLTVNIPVASYVMGCPCSDSNTLSEGLHFITGVASANVTASAYSNTNMVSTLG